MQSLRRHLANTYFSLDTRSLGAFRISLAVALFIDLALRWAVLEPFYTNGGLLPNHTLLWAPISSRMYSFFFGASQPGEVAVLMGLCAVVFGMLLIGLWTKLAQILSLIAVQSLNARLAPLENGGDIVMNLLCIWSVFLPLGERFSVDAIRASLGKRREQSPGDLNDRAPIRIPARRAYSLACCGLILQFVAIYALNAAQKSGPTWMDGDAVHYALHQDRIVKWPGIWVREHAPVGLLRALTWGTIGMEYLAAILIASPFARTYTRFAALLLFPAMHVAFDAFIDVGVFSIAMIAFYPLLIEPTHWDWLARKLAPRHRRRRLYVDDDCGFCMMSARFLARLDVLERLEFASNAEAERLPSDISLKQANESITTLELDTGKVYRGAAAVAVAVRSLPFGFLAAIPLQLPGIRGLAQWAYMRIANNRLQISLWLGFGVCGLPPSAAGSALAATEELAPARVFTRRALRVAAEACVALFLIASVSELLNSNEALPRALRHRQPEFLSALLDYGRTFQNWHMFAPHAPLTDDMIEIDALTIDGRRVDPFNQIASRVPGPGFTEIPARLNQNQFFCGYALFIWQPHFGAYRTAFQEWILRYHERTGRPNDQIVRFKVYTLSDRSPPPGQTKATEFTRREFLHFP